MNDRRCIVRLLVCGVRIKEWKGFVKKVEDFVCLFCGEKVAGTGYTDHCPKCLMSVHVDIDPGDRASNCNGAMEPIEFWKKRDKWRILYKCQKCGHEKWNDAAENDNPTLITKLSSLQK